MTWSVTITDTDGGTHEPALFSPVGEDLPRRNPTANGRPTLELGVVPKRDSNGEPKWFAEKFEEADITVTFDGTEEPVDTIVGIDDRPSAGVTVLTAVGGDVLDTNISTSFDVIETHLAAKELIEDNTSLATDIPTPSTTTEAGVLLVDTVEAGLTESSLDPPPAEDSPVHVNDEGALTLHQSLFFDEPSTTLGSVGDSISFTFDLNYSIPTDRVSAALLSDVASDPVGIEFVVDGTVVGEIAPGETLDDTAPTWTQREGADDRLAPGTHTATFAVTETIDAAGTSLSAVTPQGLAVYDADFDFDFDTDLERGPQLYGDFVYQELKEPLVTRAVTGLQWRGYHTDNEPTVPILSNGVETVASTFGQAQFTGNFQNRGPTAEVNIGLRRYGDDPNRTPQQGFKATELQGYRLSADLETMPLVVGETFDGTLEQVLNSLADTLRGDFAWGIENQSGTRTLAFVRSGSRSTTKSAIEDYSVRKDVARRLDEVRIRGGRTAVDGETIRAQHSTAVQLREERLAEGSETVVDVEDGTVYERGQAYDIDYEAGTITAASFVSRGDAIPDGGLIRVSYEYTPQATVARDGAIEPVRDATIDILSLRSDRGCQLAAQQLLEAAGSPTYQASAVVRGNTTYSVVTDLAAAALPGPASLETVDISATAAGTEVRLDADPSLGDAVGDLREQIENIAQHTR